MWRSEPGVNWRPHRVGGRAWAAPRRLRTVLGLLSLLLVGGCLPFRLSPEPTPVPWSDPLVGVSFRIGEIVRVYQLHVPASYDHVTPMPLVLVLHGGEGDGQV